MSCFLELPISNNSVKKSGVPSVHLGCATLFRVKSYKLTLENLFSAEFKDQRQQIFGAFFETNESIVFTSGEGDDRKVYKHQVYHLAQNKNIIVMRIANDKKKTDARGIPLREHAINQ